jgi:hypothetical protein
MNATELVPRAGKRGRQVIDFQGTTWLVTPHSGIRGFTFEHEASGWVFGVADQVRLPTGGWAYATQVALKDIR